MTNIGWKIYENIGKAWNHGNILGNILSMEV
jgi:hypothetical protein